MCVSDVKMLQFFNVSGALIIFQDIDICILLDTKLSKLI